VKNKWNIGFEWVVTGIALISVVFLLIQSEQNGHESAIAPSYSNKVH
jgi:hypothetical protein